MIAGHIDGEILFVKNHRKTHEIEVVAEIKIATGTKLVHLFFNDFDILDLHMSFLISEGAI